MIALVSALASSAAAETRTAGSTRVRFRTSDGVTLRGHLWNGGGTAVVFSHMYTTDQSVWYDLAARLHRQGYSVLTFDFRGVGMSSGRFVIAHVYRDTLAAVEFMRARNPEKIILAGASMGGTSSIVAAGHTKVDGLIVIASGTVFQGLDARPHLPGLRMPKIFIVGSGDSRFVWSAKTMYAQTPHPKQLLVIASGLHGTEMFETKHRDTIYRAIYDFLRKTAI